MKPLMGNKQMIQLLLMAAKDDFNPTMDRLCAAPT